MPESGFITVLILNMMLLALLLVIFSLWHGLKNELHSTRMMHRKEREINKQAILQLVDEIVVLSDGYGYCKKPCKVGARGFTGPSAEAANYLIKQEYPQAFNAGKRS